MSRQDVEGGPAPDEFRFGYVAIIGRPNVGKSTLLNALLGQKVSIVTHKPQTTRQRIAGIRTTPRGQVVYLDTPGLHRAAGPALNRYMNRVATATCRDAEIILFLVEAGRWTRQDEEIAATLATVTAPVYLTINKVDLIADKKDLLTFLSGPTRDWHFAGVFLVSALTGDGVADIEREILSVLPFSMPFYDEEQITDRNERFLAGELLREALMIRMHQEIPYALTVEIEEFRREDEVLRIGAVIWVERESQKQIVIGKGGKALKQVGAQARRSMEELFDEKVFLRTWVKVAKDWSRSDELLQRMGFDD